MGVARNISFCVLEHVPINLLRFTLKPKMVKKMTQCSYKIFASKVHLVDKHVHDLFIVEITNEFTQSRFIEFVTVNV